MILFIYVSLKRFAYVLSIKIINMLRKNKITSTVSDIVETILKN